MPRDRRPAAQPLAAVRLAPLSLLALLAALPACTTAEQYEHLARDEVASILQRVQSDVLGTREATVRQPLPAAETPDPADAPSAPAAPVEPLRLDLPDALRAAVTTGRDYLTRRESLDLEGLSLSQTRFNFGPQLASSLGVLWTDGEKLPAATTTGFADFGLSQLLATGGTFSADASLVSTGTAASPIGNTHASGVGFALTQPLLRGAGYEVSHAALTQAERDMIYEVRAFELFREDWSISIAEDYFELVSSYRRLTNLEQSYRDAVFDREKSEALRQVDRNRDEDVFLARRREINADTERISAQADYERTLDDFRLRLGLPGDRPLAIADRDPPYRPVRLDTDSAVTVALANRLDLLTVSERVGDAERNLRIARNGLLPDLELTAGLGWGATEDKLVEAFPDEWQASTGLRLGLPVQRHAERNALRAAQIALDRTRRERDESFDNVQRDIVDQLRQLKQVELQIDLQQQQIAQEQRAVAVTQIRYEAGDVENRDLLDARQSLVDAQNALIDLTARHFIARLRLLRSLGVLFIDEEGLWPD